MTRRPPAVATTPPGIVHALSSAVRAPLADNDGTVADAMPDDVDAVGVRLLPPAGAEIVAAVHHMGRELGTLAVPVADVGGDEAARDVLDALALLLTTSPATRTLMQHGARLAGIVSASVGDSRREAERDRRRR